MFKNLHELTQTLNSEQACIDYLAAQRWQDGKVKCVYCGHDKCYRSARLIKRGIKLIQGIQANERQKNIDASLLATNNSIRDQNNSTIDFYQHQRTYNNIQKILTAAIFFATGTYTCITYLSYNAAKPTQSIEQRLNKIENKLDNQEKKAAVFEKSVLDSLKHKENK